MVRGHNEAIFIDDWRRAGGGALLGAELSLESRLKPVRDRVNAGLEQVATTSRRPYPHLNQTKKSKEKSA